MPEGGSMKARKSLLGKLKPETTVALAAAVIALASLGLSIWQGFETRHHDRLSVLPVLTSTIEDSPDKEAGLTVANKGVGPAIIREQAILVDGKPVEMDEHGGWENAEKQVGIDQLELRDSNFEDGSAITVGEVVPLLVIPSKSTPDQRRLFSRAILHLTIRFVYESIYGGRQHKLDITPGLPRIADVVVGVSGVAEPGNKTFIISGSGLSGTTSVLFGAGATDHFEVVSDNEIRAQGSLKVNGVVTVMAKVGSGTFSYQGK
jgi:hypothetical protein